VAANLASKLTGGLSFEITRTRLIRYKSRSTIFMPLTTYLKVTLVVIIPVIDIYLRSGAEWSKDFS